jgi:hypothetical protein
VLLFSLAFLSASSSSIDSPRLASARSDRGELRQCRSDRGQLNEKESLAAGRSDRCSLKKKKSQRCGLALRHGDGLASSAPRARPERLADRGLIAGSFRGRRSTGQSRGDHLGRPILIAAKTDSIAAQIRSLLFPGTRIARPARSRNPGGLSLGCCLVGQPIWLGSLAGGHRSSPRCLVRSVLARDHRRSPWSGAAVSLIFFSGIVCLDFW